MTAAVTLTFVLMSQNPNLNSVVAAAGTLTLVLISAVMMRVQILRAIGL